MKHIRKTLAAALVGIAAAISVAVVAAPAQAEPSSGGTPAQVKTTAGPVEPHGISDCADVLTNAGYNLTRIRLLACGVAAAGGTVSAIGVCTSMLASTGVDIIIAPVACTAGAVM